MFEQHERDVEARGESSQRGQVRGVLGAVKLQDFALVRGAVGELQQHELPAIFAHQAGEFLDVALKGRGNGKAVVEGLNRRIEMGRSFSTISALLRPRMNGEFGGWKRTFALWARSAMSSRSVQRQKPPFSVARP